MDLGTSGVRDSNTTPLIGLAKVARLNLLKQLYGTVIMPPFVKEECIDKGKAPDKDKLIRELGADEIVRDGKGLSAARGADVILGTSNSVDAMAESVQGLRPDGRFVLMGFEPKPLPIAPADLIMRRIRIIGSQQNGPEYLYEALSFAAAGKVKVMAETYRLDEINMAYERVERGQVRFRALILN
jgi:alcohol dehydrogenase